MRKMDDLKRNDKKIELLKKLYLLRREKTEYLEKATVVEAFDVLIECCEFIIGNENELDKS